MVMLGCWSTVLCTMLLMTYRSTYYSKFPLKVTVNLLFIPHFRSNKAQVGGYLGKFKLGMCHWRLRAPTPL